MTHYKATQFSVDSHGAYLTRLTDSKGAPILFEQVLIGDKRRGGAHVCLPYFGQDAAGVLPQHGFGRDVEWKRELLDSDREVNYHYEEMKDGIPTGFSAILSYELNEARNSFSTTLVVANLYERKGPFSVSPGFHPYFAVDPSDVRLNGKKINLTNYEPYEEYPNAKDMTIESGGRIIKVWSPDMKHMVVWTDMKGDYLCVEPTFSGHSFDSTNPSGVVLNRGDKIIYSYTIEWS